MYIKYENNNGVAKSYLLFTLTLIKLNDKYKQMI